MAQALILGVVALIVALAASLLLIYGSPLHKSPEERIRRNRSIADFSFFNASSLSDRLRIRAGPNARLITALGIHNSLTTTDEGVHKAFLRRAVRAIRGANGPAWQRVCILAAETISTVKAQLYDAERGGMSLERTVRIVCLDAVLELFFSRVRLRPVDVGAADGATDIINRLWLESKKKKKQDQASILFQGRELVRLHALLDQLIPGGSEDALDIIVPAYETLWRVVLLTYVHVAFRRLDDESRLVVHHVIKIVSQGDVGAPIDSRVDNFAKVRLTLNTHASRPACLLFLEAPQTLTITMQEALRLYPPTKRIHRALRRGQVAADVEALHHDEQIWGRDALQFRPGRFIALSQNQADAYMPFGVGVHMCPAAGGFGRKVIAVLVGVLAHRLGTRESGARVWYGDEDLDRDDGNLLPADRDAMASWFVGK